jgi:nitrite reductase/ring-hydroxylating ferredoxin subunit
VPLRPGEAVVVAHAGDLQPDQMMLVRAGSRRIVLARLTDGWSAFDDRCTHRGGTLADGTLACGTVQCPWHGSQFDVRTGAVRAGPAAEPVSTYRVEVVGEQVRLIL